MTKEEAIELLVNATYSDEWQGNEQLAEANLMAIEALKAEPVHCKDCKHYIPSERIPHEGWCDDALQNVFKEDFYCGFGKRREP